MKKITTGLLCGLMLSLGVMNTGCMGSFNLAGSMYEWNKGLGSKWVNELVFFGLVIVPVYELALVADALIFNSIEFWTGSNPISMAEDEIEEQIVTIDGRQVRITATRNKFELVDLAQPDQVSELVYVPEEMAWHMVQNGTDVKLVEFRHQYKGLDNAINLYLPDGSISTVEAGSSKQEIKARLTLSKAIR